jgi:TonB family protein
MGAATTVRAHVLAWVVTLVASPMTVAGVMALNRLTAGPGAKPTSAPVTFDPPKPLIRVPTARRAERPRPPTASPRRASSSGQTPRIDLSGAAGLPGVELEPDAYQLPPVQAEELAREAVKDDPTGPLSVHEVDRPPSLVGDSLDVPVPDEFRRLQVTGQVVVKVVVDASGRVTSVKPLSATHDILIDPVCRAVRAARFEPAHHQGKPVETMFELTVPFEVG